MTYRKRFYVFSLCLVPLIMVQWYLKMIWLKIDYPGLEYCAWFSMLYFLAYHWVFKAKNRYLKIGSMWIIWLILNLIYGLLVGWSSFFLSIDLYSNLVLTLWLWFTKEKVAN